LLKAYSLDLNINVLVDDIPMGTKNFNILDKVISWMRLGKVLPYIQENDEILDFGCGSQAYLLTHVKDKIKKGVGIDYDSPTRTIAPHVAVRHFLFKDKLPFTDRSFNKIFLLAVIEHLEPFVVSKLFHELGRVLKPNGKIVVTTPTPFGKIILEFLAFTLGVISKEEVGDHKKYYNKRDLELVARNYGFMIELYHTFQFGGNSICVLRKS